MTFFASPNRAALFHPCFWLFVIAFAAATQAQEWKTVHVPGNEPGNSQNGHGLYRCWVKVPDHWTTTGSRDLWVESVTFTVDFGPGAHEVFINKQRVGGAGAFPPEFQPGTVGAHRYKAPLGILRKGEWNAVVIRVFSPDRGGRFRGTAPSIQGYFLECVLEGPWEFRSGENLAGSSEALKEKPAQAGYSEFREASRVMSEAHMLVHGERLSPGESLKRFELEAGLIIDTLLHEPLAVQPTHVSFDERGRMWVSHYAQYPYPAGLRMISRDKYYRAKYDREPKPPPNHSPGRGRVTIHEDTNGDGAYDQHKTFVDGLNLVNAALRGRGGVWVMHTPHLLFYPDRDFDDEPDGDPVVHLAGFGFEDTHSVANGLAWGPDGWLYGAQGSTVTCRVTRPGIDPPGAFGVYHEGCMVWRYQPEAREFEIFAEGGGNVFGLEFDADGRLFSGHNGGGTRGWHYVQHGIHLKQGRVPGKYGPPGNPFTFGDLPMMPGGSIPRFSHSIILIGGTAMPASWQDRLLCADPIHRHLVLSERIPRGASFKTRDLGFPVKSSDIAFRPVYMANAPDGSVCIADFYERYIAHGQHYQSQIDPTTGRIHRLRARDLPLIRDIHLRVKTDDELITLLEHPNKWHRQTAVRLLGERRNSGSIEKLRRWIRDHTDRPALDGLWALHQAGGLDDELAVELLRHPYPGVRAWAIRLAGDKKTISSGLAGAIEKLAANEGHPEVRSQIAGTAQRLTATQALRFTAGLIRRVEDVDDPYIPLLCWWVLEKHCESDRAKVLNLFEEPEFWHHPMVERHLLERLARRLTGRGRQDDFLAFAHLLRKAPANFHRAKLMQGFGKALEGQALPKLPNELLAALSVAGEIPPTLQIRQGNKEVIDKALKTVTDDAAPTEKRIDWIHALDGAGVPGTGNTLMHLVRTETDAGILKAALPGLQHHPEKPVAGTVLARYSTFPEAVQPTVLLLLASRPEWSLLLLTAVAEGTIAKPDIAPSLIDLLIGQGGETAAAATRLWPAEQQKPATDSDQVIGRIRTVLNEKPGNPYRGREIFMQRCSSCHRLFHKGASIGPDLTNYQRDDLDTLLPGIIDPSAEIREGFEHVQIRTQDGRFLSGFMADQGAGRVILRGIDGSDISIPREQIAETIPNPRSLMPENLLTDLSNPQLRDFFAYLRVSQPIRN